VKRKIIYLFLFVSLISCYPLARYVKKKCNGKYDRADIAIRGPILMADGIGRHTAELAQVLNKKFQVQIISNHIVKTDVPQGILDILKRKYKKPAPIVIVEESLWAPGNQLHHLFDKVNNKDQIRFAYTMLESTRIIPEWVLLINLYFDAIIVPDRFLINAYKDSGVTVPIFYIPLGLDLQEFLKKPLKEPKNKGPFVFACLGSGIERKNHILTIQAFAKALGNNKNAHLYINCRFATPEVREAIISEILNQKCNNIYYTELSLKKDAYLKFFSQVDVLLSFSKGEGYSIQPREAMALGIPVILSDNTGQSTICQNGLVKFVSSTIAEPRYYYDNPLPNGGLHFNCSVEEAAAAIQDVYFNYTSYASKGPMMREWAKKYDYEYLAMQYESLIAPKKIDLGEENEISEDGITTDSLELYNKYIRLLKIKNL
jgi:glycosyltransferase involved in cell wall biosynthesis